MGPSPRGGTGPRSSRVTRHPRHSSYRLLPRLTRSTRFARRKERRREKGRVNWTSDERSEETSDGGATGLVNEENLSHQSLHLLITLLIHLIRRSRPLRGVNEMESEE